MAVIRPLCAQDDFNEVGDVYAQSWKACYQGLLPQAFLDKQIGRASCRERV